MTEPINPQQRRLSRKYLAYQLLTNLWFIGPIWLYFYRIFITDYQVGIVDGFAFAVGLLAEVPSGALADRFGRDKMVKLGQVLAGSGLLVQVFGSSFVPFFVGQAIVMIGTSFISGADEALFFDKLGFDRSSVHWRKLVTRGSQVSQIGMCCAVVAGGWLYGIDPRMPWILTGLAFMSSALVLWSIKETLPKRSKQSLSAELREYYVSIKHGIMQFRTPKLWLYVPIIITVQGLFYTVGYGLLRLILLDRFHFDPFFGAVAIATSSLITIGILAVMHRYSENLSEKQVFVLISLGVMASLLLSLADIGVWGYAVIIILYAGEHMLYPFMSEALNKQTEPRQRATVLSVASFLRTVPYVALAPIIGYLNTQSALEYFLIVWAALIGAAVLVYLSRKKKDARLSIAEQEANE